MTVVTKGLTAKVSTAGSGPFTFQTKPTLQLQPESPCSTDEETAAQKAQVTCLRSHPCLCWVPKPSSRQVPCHVHTGLWTPQGQHEVGTDMLSGGVCWLTSWLDSCRVGDVGIPVPLLYEGSREGDPCWRSDPSPQTPSCLSPLHPQTGEQGRLSPPSPCPHATLCLPPLCRQQPCPAAARPQGPGREG